MTTPFLSLIIPTHNRSKLLSRAINSINSQAFRELIEIIVISDIIDLDTEMVCVQLLKPQDIYIRRNGLMGPSESRNIGMNLSSGNHVMFLDDDDSWVSSFFKDLLSTPNLNELGVVYFNCNVVKESRTEAGPVLISESHIDTKDTITNEIFIKNQIHMSCLFFPRSAIERLSFDKSMRAYEDWDFILSVFERRLPTHLAITCSNIYEVDDITTDRRGSSQAALDFNAPIDYLYVYRRHKAPSFEIQNSRSNLLSSVGLTIEPHYL